MGTGNVAVFENLCVRKNMYYKFQTFKYDWYNTMVLLYMDEPK